MGVKLLLLYRYPLLTSREDESELETDVPGIYSVTVRSTDPDDRDNEYKKRRLLSKFCHNWW
jgi:hypothetical protein